MLPILPFYIFYSMFGFQRVGDMIWSCGDMMCRGFLLGGTAGRTTLNGEGMQHEDGHSQLLATTIPNLLSYDPAFGYEVAVIVQDGLRRMYTLQENVFYYITLYNKNYLMPKLDDCAQESSKGIREGILQGGYCLQRRHVNDSSPTAQLLASGSILQQALLAAEWLVAAGINVVVWSITSFSELEREALSIERENRLRPDRSQRQSYVAQMFANETGVFVAATDYMKKVAAAIASWVPGRYEILGTDGYGMSETRHALRRHFEVSSDDIAYAAVSALIREGLGDTQTLMAMLAKLDVDVD